MLFRVGGILRQTIFGDFKALCSSKLELNIDETVT